jgi:NCS1 family nucleobase:cation symporter-1
MPAMAIALPVTVTITAMFGVFITTATEYMNEGTIQWNPLLLMITIQQQTYTPISRCATFFAGVAILLSQIFVNITQNTIPYGIDLASMFPRYLSRRRACLILVVLALRNHRDF